MNRFKTEHILVVLFPLIASIIGAILAGMPPSLGTLNIFQISIVAALLTGVIALFYRYLAGPALWYVVIGAPILLSILMILKISASISIFALVLPNLAYSLATLGMLKYLYYSKLFLRLRTLLIGLSGGLLLSGYLAAIDQLINLDPAADGMRQMLYTGFNSTFLSSLIIYVFIAFAMSVADLIILQKEVKRLKAESDSPHD
jgi:hypothetical protein